MARATVIVEAWVPSLGWEYYRGYPEGDEVLALLRAEVLEQKGVPVRVYRRTPEGPKIIYESPRP